MKTIEERAKEYAPGTSNSDSLFPTRISTLAAIERRGYIAGATEQKAIDDAECANQVLMGKGSSINYYKQGYHDAVEKACEWLEGYCCEIGCKYDCNFDDIMVDGLKRFRKTMEKEL